MFVFSIICSIYKRIKKIWFDRICLKYYSQLCCFICFDDNVYNGIAEWLFNILCFLKKGQWAKITVIRCVFRLFKTNVMVDWLGMLVQGCKFWIESIQCSLAILWFNESWMVSKSNWPEMRLRREHVMGGTIPFDSLFMSSMYSNKFKTKWPPSTNSSR